MRVFLAWWGSLRSGEIDPQYQVVAQHLLGRVLIVERLEDAQPVLERLKRRRTL